MGGADLVGVAGIYVQVKDVGIEESVTPKDG